MYVPELGRAIAYVPPPRRSYAGPVVVTGRTVTRPVPITAVPLPPVLRTPFIAPPAPGPMTSPLLPAPITVMDAARSGGGPNAGPEITPTVAPDAEGQDQPISRFPWWIVAVLGLAVIVMRPPRRR